MADISWPSVLPDFLLQGYTYRRRDIVTRTQLESGRTRMRQRQSDGPTECVGHFVMTGAQFSYFESWFLHKINAGAAPFNLSLIPGSGYQVHEVKFLEPYSMPELIRADLFRVSVRLEVRKLQVFSEEFLNTLEAYLADGGTLEGFYAFFDIFEIYVNVDLPASEMGVDPTTRFVYPSVNPATINVDENELAVPGVTATGQVPITYSIIGGADAALFEIDANTGEMAFLSAPDYEAPSDANADNTYIVTVRASGPGGTADQTLHYVVQDVVDTPPAGAIEHWRYNQGITETGLGVSQWDGAIGGHHFLQGTDAARPSKEVDGSILFNGSQYLVTDAWTQAQPLTICLLFKQITWSIFDAIFYTTANMGLIQGSATPILQLYAGVSAVANNDNLALDTYGGVIAVYNGASSLLHIEGAAATTGSPGTVGLSNLSLGARPDGGGASNIQVKDMIAYDRVLDAAERQHLFDYWATL